ncbi:TRAP transporter large permease [Nitratireductor pacificus]|uniref:TRAP transporter large permease protein n=1 Tax=Nitratireductor pacificus pht-3B TaxID=391937 RepID=K2M913_9HYPH|nr:TRAP transporter large permease [Nitratireductor pacificus]EKF18601.1 TRAP dicarboxylate transporter [Nitratireductor pacificus pht-3B]
MGGFAFAFKGLTVFWGFLILLALGVPVFFAMIGAGVFQLWQIERMAFLGMQVNRVYSGISSFPIMAVPFFILAGEIMNSGMVTRALVDFSRAMLGHIRGGLAHVNIAASVLFAGLSGSAVADTSALGSMLIPAMEKNGYSRKFAAAITAASSVIGPVIPPSGLMVLYAFVMNVDVARMFLGGIVPGLMLAGALMAVTAFMAHRFDFPVANERMAWKQRGQAGLRAFFPLLTPIILLGGILSGYFTPTEAAAVAVAYALLLNIGVKLGHRFGLIDEDGFGLRAFYGILKRTSIQSGVVLLLVGVASGFSQIVAIAGVPAMLTNAMLSVSDNVLVFLLLVNIFLFIVGMVLDAGPAILILGPILAPAATAYGIEPVHFAVMMCLNVTVGLATPPMGLVLFVATSISGARFSEIVRAIIPFLIAEIVVILLVAYIPVLTLGLPWLWDNWGTIVSGIGG